MVRKEPWRTSNVLFPAQSRNQIILIKWLSNIFLKISSDGTPQLQEPGCSIDQDILLYFEFGSVSLKLPFIGYYLVLGIIENKYHPYASSSRRLHYHVFSLPSLLLVIHILFYLKLFLLHLAFQCHLHLCLSCISACTFPPLKYRTLHFLLLINILLHNVQGLRLLRSFWSSRLSSEVLTTSTHSCFLSSANPMTISSILLTKSFIKMLKSTGPRELLLSS